MAKNIFILLAVLGVASAVSGQSDAQQRYVADKVVAVVGGSPILYSDVVLRAREITATNREQNYTSDRDPLAEALESLLEQKLLYQRAQIDSIGLEYLAPNIANAVEGEVAALVARAGSIRALETERNKALYEIKDEMSRDLEEFHGANEMRNHVTSPVKVTPGEVDRFFRGMDPDSLPIIPEQYVYAQITKLPRSSELARQRTRERLLELRQRIIDGDRFEVLARMYSQDMGSVMRGGEYDPTPKEQWVFGDDLVKLKPGQISGVVETEYGFHIIQLLDKSEGTPVLYHFRHILLKPVYTDDELTETVDFLDSLAGVVRKGELTFEEAALKYSDDKASRMNGGLVSNQEMLSRMYGNTNPKDTNVRFVKDFLEPGDAAHLIQMKVGEISKAFIGANMQLEELAKILRLVEIIPAHKANLSEDWLAIETMVLSRKQGEHYLEWLNGKIDEMYVRIDPMFHKEDFMNRRWFK